jgi:hypothetical protein
VAVHDRFEAVAASREALLGRSNGSHDVCGLGTLRGRKLLAEGADRRVDLGGRRIIKKKRLLIHTA